MSKLAKKVLFGMIFSSVIALPGCAYQFQPEGDLSEVPSDSVPDTLKVQPINSKKVLDGVSFYHILLAELALMNDRPEVALELFLAAWKDYPNDAALLQTIAPLAARLGNAQLSFTLYQSWAQAEPNQIPAWQGLWQISLSQINPDSASHAAENLLRLKPNYDLNIPFLIFLGWPADAANSFYQALLEQNEDLIQSNDGIKLLGILQTQMGEVENARRYWNQLSQTLTNQDSFLTYSESLFALELFEGASILATAAQHKFPQDPAMAGLKAKILRAQDESELALQTLLPWFNQPSTPATELLVIMAELATTTHHPRRNEWLAALLETPAADSARLLLAEVAMADKDFAQARVWLNDIHDATQAVAAKTLLITSLNQAPLTNVNTDELFEQWRNRFPNAPAQMLEQQARYWFDLGLYERAYDLYSLGLRADPNDFFFLYMRALSAEPLNRLESLEQDLRRILSLDPSNTAALNALGYTLIDRTDRIEEAALLIEQAFAQSPDSFAITDTLGWLRFKQGRYAEAVEILARALALQDESIDDDEVVSHYVEALWRNGQSEKARAVATDWLSRYTATDRLKYLLNNIGLNP